MIIGLSNSELVAVVDEADYKMLSAFKWRVMHAKSGNVYAINGRKRLMHRMIMANVERIDHRDGDGLNNRRSNLRPCSHRQNMQNQKKPVSNTSGFKGVTFEKNRKGFSKWRVQIQKNKHVGYFSSAIEAAIAYNNAAIALFGEFARLNPIPDATALTVSLSQRDCVRV